MPKQHELLLKGAGAGNECANPVCHTRGTDFDTIDPAANGCKDIRMREWRSGRAGRSEGSHGGVRG